MPSVHNLIGERFENILQRIYPELKRTNGNVRVPDFETDDFYLEAKVTFFDPAYYAQLHEYQIDSFKILNKTKPVLYVIGVHNFEKSMIKLSGLPDRAIRLKLARSMHVDKIIIVDNATIERFWKKNNKLNDLETIRYCGVRASHLHRIIENKTLKAEGVEIPARKYYGVQSKDYLFSSPIYQPNKDISVGHIMPEKLEYLLKQFYD